MSWCAKLTGGYDLDSDYALANINQIYGFLTYTVSTPYTAEAVAAMCGNFYAESGLNPWRWQSDTVSLTSKYKGYGLAQFTPAYGYIYDYGAGLAGYSPNLNVTTQTATATPDDGFAQMLVIVNDLAGKFLNRASYCSYADISSCYPLSAFSQVTDLYTATVGWLYNYEFPADRSESVAQTRYSYASTIYEYITGITPIQPDSPGSASPTPSRTSKKMPVWLMSLKHPSRY